MALARSDTLHSRVVAALKVTLPLIALVILSTLFLVSRSIDPSDAIPYAKVDVEDRIREPRMTAPTYAGVTSDGARLSMVAEAARPAAGATAARAEGMAASLVTPDGATTTFTAPNAVLDSVAKRLNLEGGVRIVTSQGYVITTDRLSAALDRTDLKSDGAIAATGPLGQLQAGEMVLSVTATPGSYVLLFQKGVKMVYQPPE
jgi:lipopolysaccharide export system protein LptC